MPILVDDHSQRHLARSRSSTRPAAPTPICSPPRRPGHPIAPCWWPITRPPGKGRLDRRWEAPPGTNLLVSLLFRDVPEHPHQLTQRVALAAVAGVRRGRRCLPGAEVAERSAARRPQAGRRARPSRRSRDAEYVVVGIGLNVGWAPEGAARLGDGYDPADVLDAMLVAYDRPAGLTSPTCYRAGLATIGQSVRVELSGSEVVRHERSTCFRRPARRARRMRDHASLRHRRRRSPPLTCR